MAELTGSRRDGARGATLLINDAYAGPVKRSASTGEVMRALSVELLCTEGANQGLPAQEQPALNVDGTGRPLKLWYPDAVVASISVAAARGPARAQQLVRNGAGKAVGAAYVVRADVAAVTHPKGVYPGEPGQERYDLRIVPESIEPAPGNLIVPLQVLAKQSLAVQSQRARAQAQAPDGGVPEPDGTVADPYIPRARPEREPTRPWRSGDGADWRGLRPGGEPGATVFLVSPERGPDGSVRIGTDGAGEPTVAVSVEVLAVEGANPHLNRQCDPRLGTEPQAYPLADWERIEQRMRTPAGSSAALVRADPMFLRDGTGRQRQVRLRPSSVRVPTEQDLALVMGLDTDVVSAQRSAVRRNRTQEGLQATGATGTRESSVRRVLASGERDQDTADQLELF